MDNLEHNQPADRSLRQGILQLAADLTTAWLANPNTQASADDVPAFLKTLHVALRDIGNAGLQPPETFEPAVSVRKSLGSNAHIVSMIDGKPYRTLKRHLGKHGLTPAEYRARYKLPADYPMVAADYSAKRSEMARNAGLGRKTDGPSAVKEAPKSTGKPLPFAEAMAAARTRLGLKY
jgi:predicted transcriptional regulator